MDFRGILKFIPEIKSPEEKKLSFREKAKWTIIVLLSFFVLSNIPLFGLSANALSQFQYLAIILGTNFGSIISLGNWANRYGFCYSAIACWIWNIKY